MYLGRKDKKANPEGPVGPKGEPGKDATVDDIRKAFAEVLADPELNKLAFAKLLQVQEVVGQQEQEIERRRLVALRPAVAAIRQSIENATQGAVVPAEKPAPQQPMTKKRWFSFTR